MEDRLTAREIGAYIELKKKVAEEEYKLNYIKNTAGDHSTLIEEIEDDLRENRSKMKIIEGKMEARRVEIVVPNQTLIEEYSELISRLPREEVATAIRTKSGDTYTYLAERGKLIKRNIETKNEIGKLNILLANASPEVKECIHETLKSGKPSEKEANLNDDAGQKMVRLLNRMGIRCKASGEKLEKHSDDIAESRVVVNNEYFWIPKDKMGGFTENEKLLASVSVKLQVKNAEMQAITFNEAQQKEFQELQTQYMDLLKGRREVIGAEENELSISI